jgi:hypothetical protein
MTVAEITGQNVKAYILLKRWYWKKLLFLGRGKRWVGVGGVGGWGGGVVGGWGVGGGADNDWPAEWENYGALGKYSREKVMGKTPPYCLVVLSSNCYSFFNLVIF